MSGMLMSMRTTSGVSSVAIDSDSEPDAAEPTTSMSLSKPRSLVRWSRVSGMSSTIRTRIWSAIRQWVRWSRRWFVDGGSFGSMARSVRRARDRRSVAPVAPLGQVVVARATGAVSRLGLCLRREDGLHELGDRNPEVGGQLLEGDALGA